jgi:hypothetical protein
MPFDLTFKLLKMVPTQKQSHPSKYFTDLARLEQLGPLLWPKVPSVDFSRPFVRENKTTRRKRMIEIQDYC